MQNMRERITEAKRFIWKGDSIEYTAELYAGLLDAHRRLLEGEVETECVVDDRVLFVALTEVEDLLDLCRQAQMDLVKARKL